MAINQDCATSNLSISCHLEYHGSCLPCLLLPDKALRRYLGLERVIVDTETANVRMRRDEVEAAELLALGDGGDGLRFVSQVTRESRLSPTMAMMMCCRG